MKAEERKELETNSLATTLGEAVKKAKGTDRWQLAFSVIAGAIVALGVYLYYANRQVRMAATSMSWLGVENGGAQTLGAVVESGEKNPARAARLQLAWFQYWENGVRLLGVEPTSALKNVKDALNTYRNLADECGDDPTFHSEAMLGIAAAEETLSLERKANFESAIDRYRDVAQKYPKTAAGRTAQAWLDRIENPEQRKKIEDGYDELRRNLRIIAPAPALAPPPAGGAPGVAPIPVPTPTPAPTPGTPFDPKKK